MTWVPRSSQLTPSFMKTLEENQQENLEMAPPAVPPGSPDSPMVVVSDDDAVVGPGVVTLTRDVSYNKI